ncbi:MAG TPA: choice-of-anchor tandem repeat NxxGxxAF-containing protein [Blastocatellia bacterium]|nr:choice-of-anchor tandem repeat NxxGxxAF-containing protein [Blastocatellia bacterium]
MKNKNSIKVLGVLSLILVLNAAIWPMQSQSAQKSKYDFSVIGAFGDPAPGGGFFTSNFAPFSLNKRGELAFAADIQMTQGGSDLGQGVFVASNGQLSQIARVGLAAPGGGTFAKNIWPFLSMNKRGDVVFAMSLVPVNVPPPAGVNSGVYRFSRANGTLSAVVVPYITQAPAGGTFQGAHVQPIQNKGGDIVFSGIVLTEQGTRVPGQDYPGLGMGIFRADDKSGETGKVVAPGDPAPGGGSLDYATRPWINDAGDIAFDGHVAGEECLNVGGGQSRRLGCPSSVYFISAGTSQIQAIACQGDPAPGGGAFRFAIAPQINNRGEILFTGDLTEPPGISQRVGIFLYSSGQIVPVARPGDAMPGGGNAATATSIVGIYTLNNRGDAAVNLTLDSDVDGDGKPDTGVYLRSRTGSLSVLARTGTMISGVGTIVSVTRAIINDRGQVAFTAQLTDGRTVLLLAIPR